MPIDITVAEQRHFEDVATMVEALLADIMAAIGQQTFHVEGSRIRELAQDWLRMGPYQVLLAQDRTGGGAVGFLALFEGYALYAGGRFGIIPEFYVRPAYRSQGIGTSLIDAATVLARARGWTRLEVTTPPLPPFERTLKFYERRGFVISGGRKLKMDLS